MFSHRIPERLISGRSSLSLDFVIAYVVLSHLVFEASVLWKMRPLFSLFTGGKPNMLAYYEHTVLVFVTPKFISEEESLLT